MYISSLDIKLYKSLEDIKINFQIPKDGQNAINLLAGANGSGKSSILDLILKSFENENTSESFINADFVFKFNEDWQVRKKKDSQVHIKNHPQFNLFSEFKDSCQRENEYKNGAHSSPRLIYMPNKISFKYEPNYKLNNRYSFVERIISDHVLVRAENFIKEYIIRKERQSVQSDPKKRTDDAVACFNQIFRDSDFATKLVDLDYDNDHRPIFESINKKRIPINKLSDGEKQLYGRVISLLSLNPNNSIILIDEPENSLHPQWQYAIMDIYKNIGENNQFIVTTHSPYIISQFHYKDIILLKRDHEKIVVEQFERPPLARDINNILQELMGTDFIPQSIRDMRNKYRQLVEEGKGEEEEGKNLKKELLKYESEESEFMQSIYFYNMLRDEK